MSESPALRSSLALVALYTSIIVAALRGDPGVRQRLTILIVPYDPNTRFS